MTRTVIFKSLILIKPSPLAGLPNGNNINPRLACIWPLPPYYSLTSGLPLAYFSLTSGGKRPWSVYPSSLKRPRSIPCSS